MNDSRERLNAISKSLIHIHRTLLMMQKAHLEGLENRVLSSHELLQALFSNPDFEWLRTLSTLIARIDEVADDKKALHAKFYDEVLIELRGIFNNSDQNIDFKRRLKNALQENAELRAQVSSFRKLIQLSEQ